MALAIAGWLHNPPFPIQPSPSAQCFEWEHGYACQQTGSPTCYYEWYKDGWESVCMADPHALFILPILIKDWEN